MFVSNRFSTYYSFPCEPPNSLIYFSTLILLPGILNFLALLFNVCLFIFLSKALNLSTKKVVMFCCLCRLFPLGSRYSSLLCYFQCSICYPYSLHFPIS